ncbi:MAG: GNAT family N-acetyltransferase [Anaerolineae bacterium]
MCDPSANTPPRQEPPPCRLLPWDTDFFGFRIARVQAPRLTPEGVEQIDTWCRQNNVRCLYFLAAAGEARTIRLAEENDFRLVDVRVTLSYTAPEQPGARPSPAAGDLDVRPATAADLPELARIARLAHGSTRFFADPGFSRRRSEQLYETWITNSCQGYADAVYVAKERSRPVGYISCHRDGETGAGRIGLTAVRAEARGRGIGQALVRQALDWFLTQGAREVAVVTQGSNRAAQRLYQRCGFLTDSVQLWYHKWYPLN